MPVSPARAAAFDVLLRVEEQAAYASELLHSERCDKLSRLDQALTTELVMGVLRWRSALDEAIASVSAQNLTRLDVEVLTCLRMGAYQLAWLDRVPAHAAIHESVELVKRARKRSAVPFANAILRKLADHPDRIHGQEQTLLVASNPQAIAKTSAHPLWLVERWAQQFGIETAARICAFDQVPPVTSIRLRDPAAENDLRKQGIELEPGALLANARRVVAGDVTKTKPYADGRIAIQDEASQLVAALVGKGNRILDCCAAPGGKTWSIADRNPNASIVALELHERRAQLLRKRVSAHNVHVITGDICELAAEELFDRVLADVPCSGTGTINRNPEIKWRLRQEDLSHLHARQVKILQAAARHLAPGGTLIYSTCSLEREENEAVIDEVLAADAALYSENVKSELHRIRQANELSADFFVDSVIRGSCVRTIPGTQPTEGFFAASLGRVRVEDSVG
jgi:16S rRNA (cytosine967-C5)-methyltransferase